MSLASNIKRARKEKGLTQNELAGKLGVSQKTISKYETGEQIPDGFKIVYIARYLGTTAEELVSE